MKFQYHFAALGLLSLSSFVTAADTKSETDNAAEAIAAAKEHLRALMTCDKQTLSKSYAAKVGRLRTGDTLDREQAIQAALKQFAGGSDIPAAAIGLLIGRLKFDSLPVNEGEFVTEPSPAVSTKDGRLRFQIAKRDAVIEIMQGRSSWFLQLRKANGEWTVVAEYTD